MKTSRQLLVAFACLVAAAPTACTLDEPPAPAVSGPSGLANAFTLAASPNQLPRDGSSQSLVTLTATDVDGGPLGGQRYRVSVSPTETGLAITELTTDPNGRASFVVTAPPSNSSAGSISVSATALGGFADTTTRTLSIALIGDSNTPVDPPTITSVTVEPGSPVADQPSVFSASASAASGHRIVQYEWQFGDGTSAITTQPQVIKTYTIPGSYGVLLTVTDDAGGTASTVITIGVVNATLNAPVARFTVSPAQPGAGQVATFDASSSTAANRAVIVRYAWNFGDGQIEETTTPTIGHVYEEARTYAVTLTVTDNLNQTSSVGRQVVVGP